MSNATPSPDAWAAEQLTAYLSSLTSADDRAAIVRMGLDLAAEVLEAEVAALVHDEQTEAVIGFPTGAAPTDWLHEVARDRPAGVEIPSLGAGQLLVAPFEAIASSCLVVARVGDAAFSQQERNLFRGMSRVLSLYLKVAETLEAERAVREVSEARAAENAKLLRSGQERQALLERLARIQRSITRGAPVNDVLEAVVAGAAELCGSDMATLRRIDPADPEYADLICTVGIPEGSPILGRTRLGSGASGRAIAEDQLVVMHDYQHQASALSGPKHAGVRAAMAAPVRENGQVVGSLLVASRDAQRRYSQVEQEMLLSFADHASLAISDARSAEALRQALTDARHDAMHDVLTGLPNRALLKDRIAHAWERSERSGSRMALLFLDLDNFKHINDSLGHDAGDQLLIAVGKLLSDALRPSDTIARLGGDEFAVLMEDLATIDDAEVVAERLLTALTSPVTIADREIELTASIGIATSEEIVESRSLLRSADLAMYAAKRMGGGRAVRFQPDMHRRTLDRLDLEHDLRRAIDGGQLALHYQPIIDLASGEVVAVEALCRWQHPTRGAVPPTEFIRVAETSRLIRPLGEWVLRQACRQASEWPATIELTVNLSPRQVDAELPALVATTLAEAGMSPSRLTLEVTEGIAMDDSRERRNIFNALRSMGVRLAIDDFGTGYSSLARLRALAVDHLKIDRTFVADLDDAGGAAILGAIVALSRAAGLVAVAEGVETAVQLERLRELGCDRAQGYLIGRPTTAERLAAEFSWSGFGVPLSRAADATERSEMTGTRYSA